MNSELKMNDIYNIIEMFFQQDLFQSYITVWLPVIKVTQRISDTFINKCILCWNYELLLFWFVYIQGLTKASSYERLQKMENYPSLLLRTLFVENWNDVPHMRLFNVPSLTLLMQAVLASLSVTFQNAKCWREMLLQFCLFIKAQAGIHGKSNGFMSSV